MSSQTNLLTRHRTLGSRNIDLALPNASQGSTPMNHDDVLNVIANLFDALLVRQDPLISSGSDLVVVGQKNIWADVHAIAAQFSPARSATAGMPGDPALGNQFTFASHAVISRTEGCALSLGCGYALGQQFARTGHHAYVVLDADDCLNTTMREAAALAGAHRLRSLIVMVVASAANAQLLDHQLTELEWGVKRFRARDELIGAFAPTDRPKCLIFQPSGPV